MFPNQVEAPQRGRKRRLGLRTSNKRQNPVEDTPGVGSSELISGDTRVTPSDGMSSKLEIRMAGTHQTEALSCGDRESVGGSEIIEAAGDNLGLVSSGLTRVKSTPVVRESSGNDLLEEHGFGMDDQVQLQQKRLNETVSVIQVNESKEKGGNENGSGNLSSLTRKRLAEFRAPDSVGDPDVLSEIVVNIDHVENSHDIKKTKYCDQIINTNKTGEDTEIVKGVQKKSSSGNLLSFVTKMKFNTTKLKLDSDYDPFKQDDLDAEFGLDM